MKKFDSINVIPFIDIILVLLAIVLATATFISQGKVSISIPESQSKNTVVADDMVEVITIDKAGAYFYNDKPTNLDSLKIELDNLNTKTKVTLKVDADTAFQKFITVTDVLKEKKITKVSVITQRDSNE